MYVRPAVGSLAALALAALWPAPAPATIVAQVPAFVQVAQDEGPAPLLQPIHLVLHLPYPNAKAVQRFVRAVSDPHSPLFGHYLKHEQFIANFGPTPKAYSMVEYVVGQAGLGILKKYENRKVIDVMATVAEADLLFGTVIHEYSYNGATYYANALPAQLPDVLGNLVEAVSGFTNAATKIASPPMFPAVHPLAPASVQKAYDEPIYAHPQLQGNGTTIAIETAYDYLDSDLATFLSTFGISRTGSITRVPVADLVNQALPLPGANEETTLDVEQVAANAPGANVVVYEAADALDSTFDDMYAMTVNDPSIDVVTTSFGSCEAGFDPYEAQADDELFEQAAAEGQTRIAASGDFGSHDCGQNSPPFGLPGEPNPNTVDFPASSPNVLAAGGTTLRLRHDGTIALEKAWPQSGGGVSSLFALPSYQQGVANVLRGGRNVPDLAMDADPRTPYAFCYDGSFAQGLGGTSAVAPNLAATFAQIDQATGHRQGLAQGALYALLRSSSYPGSVFYDVTDGSNGKYRAEPGYDQVTGAGSLFGAAYLQLLAPARARFR